MSDLTFAMLVKLGDQFTNPAKKVLGASKKLASGIKSDFNTLLQGGKKLGAYAMKGGALLAAGGWAFKRTFVDTASEFERYRTILETIEGSSAAAQKSMDWVSGFAAKTPYELGQVTDAFKTLKSYGFDPTNGLLRTLGDASAALGKDVSVGVEAIADAVMGENERLKEAFSIKASVNGDEITYHYIDLKDGLQKTATAAKDNRLEIERTLTTILNNNYAGGMAKMSSTWAGMISNLSDWWTNFQNMVMESGLFDWMKGKLGGALEKLNELAASGEVKKYAELLSNKLVRGFEKAWRFGGKLVDVVEEIAGYANVAAEFVGGWENAALILVSLPIVATLAGIVTALNPVTLGIAAIGTAGYLLYQNWETLANAFGNIWVRIKATFADGVVSVLESMDTVFAAMPDWALPESLESANLGSTIGKYREMSDLTGKLKPVDWKGFGGGGTKVEQKNNYNITVAPQPGANAKQTAQQMRRELEAHDRKQATELRDALYDGACTP